MGNCRLMMGQNKAGVTKTALFQNQRKNMNNPEVIVIGSGNAALCAALAALEKGAKVLIIEKADKAEMGGNSRYNRRGDALCV